MSRSDTDPTELKEKPFDLRKSIEGINRKLDSTIATDIAQNERLESMEIDIGKLNTAHEQREGASKLTAKMVALLGGLVVAGFTSLFAYLWAGNASQTRRDAAIERIDERQTEHMKLPGHTELDRRVFSVDRRVDGVERSQVTLQRDVDQQGEKIEELRETVARPRWGR